MKIVNLFGRLSRLLAVEFGDVSVTGTVRKVTVSAAGHMYFCLADGDSRLACIVLHGVTARLGHKPSDGDLVTARGAVMAYAPKGQLQFVVSSLGKPG